MYLVKRGTCTAAAENAAVSGAFSRASACICGRSPAFVTAVTFRSCHTRTQIVTLRRSATHSALAHMHHWSKWRTVQTLDAASFPFENYRLRY